MKFICIRCNEYMNQIKVDVLGENSINIIFKCSKCNNQIAMVKKEGLNIVGTSENDGVTWTKEAEERLKRVPPFVQPMARQSIVNYAKEKGVREITLRVMDEVKEKA